MAKNPDDALAPIRRAITVSWDQEAAFRRFTADFATWWPRYALSIGGPRVKQVVFECRVGGLIYEEHRDGTRFRWGQVTAFDPPRRVAFTYHATRNEADAQQIDISFIPDRAGKGTRVELVSTGWEKMGTEAARAHRGFQLSWTAMLDGYAGRFSGMLLFFNAMQTAISMIGQRNTFIRNSLGKMPGRPAV